MAGDKPLLRQRMYEAIPCKTISLQSRRKTRRRRTTTTRRTKRRRKSRQRR